MSRRFTSIGLSAGALLVALALAAGAASAQNTSGNPPPFRGGRGGGGGSQGLMGFLGPIGMLSNQLGLTDDQREKIKGIAQSHADEWKGLLKSEQQARQAEQAAISATPFDEIAIRQRSAELAAVNAEIAVARGRAHAELLTLLTADQQTRLNDLAAKGPRGRGRGPKN